MSAWAWRHRFDRLQALIGADEADAHVDVIAPLPVVATWLPIPRANPDALTSEEAAPTLDAFAEIVRDHLGVRSGGRPLQLTIDSVGLLAPNAPNVHGATRDSAAGPLAYWSACAVVRLRAEGALVDGAVELRWSLFNAAIRRVRCASEADPALTEREINPSTPVTTWRLRQ